LSLFFPLLLQCPFQLGRSPWVYEGQSVSFFWNPRDPFLLKPEEFSLRDSSQDDLFSFYFFPLFVIRSHRYSATPRFQSRWHGLFPLTQSLPLCDLEMSTDGIIAFCLYPFCSGPFPLRFFFFATQRRCVTYEAAPSFISFLFFLLRKQGLLSVFDLR